ncbi:MAG: SPOR domain-containing protein [Erythrobacter sp.]|jgi:cell division septation protein DedD|nr:SPOR domain-containing protein [Erythrobacter sp.]
MSGRIFAIIAAACAAAIAVPATADVKQGVDAWSAGEYDRAVKEWSVPASEGDPDALFNLAQAYRLGRGVPADITRARELYSEAAQKGHVKAADNYGLLLFQQGEQQSAMPLIRAAADRGDPRAQYVLGLAHFNADYAEKDWPRAYALLTLAQGSGLPQARDALAQMDKFVPMTQRQEAQVLARALEAEAGKRRAAELAALELGAAPGAQDAPSLAAPARVAAAAPAPEPIIAPAAKPAPVPVASATPPVRATRGDWAVQLGAFGVAGNAERLWQKLSGHPALAGTSKLLLPTGRVTRLQAVGFASRAEAGKACSRLKAQGQDCIVAGG